MPECQSCGAHLTPDAVRVLYPEGASIEGCPHCGVRERGSYRPKRNDQRGAANASRHEAGDGPGDPTLRPREGVSD